jgi:HK97 family phage portal protein
VAATWRAWLGGALTDLADTLSARNIPPGDGFSVGVPSHVGPDGLHVTMGVDGLYQWFAQYGVNWRNSAVAYRCIVAIATNAANTPLEMIDEQSGEAVPDRVCDLWNHAPNDYMSARMLREITWLRLETKGQAYVMMDRGASGQGEVAGLHVLDSSWGVEPLIDNAREDGLSVLVGYRINSSSGRSGVLLPDEMLWLRYPDPDDIWSCLSPLRAATFALELDDYARRYQTSSLARGGAPGGVVYLGDVDEETHRKIRADLAARHERPEDAGRHLVLSGPIAAKYDRITLTAEEVSYLDTRLRSAEEVMLAYGVPRDYLMGGTTYENRDAARTTLWSDTIVPKLQVVASEIDLTTQPDPRYTARFNTDDVEALQESNDATVARLTSLVQTDVLTMDEARAEVGQDPLPDGIGAVTLTVYRARATSIGAHQLPDIHGDNPFGANPGDPNNPNPFAPNPDDPNNPNPDDPNPDDNPADRAHTNGRAHHLPLPVGGNP